MNEHMNKGKIRSGPSRVVLIHPRGFGYVKGKPDVTHLANRMPPLGLLSIAAYLRAQGVAVSVVDLCARPEPMESLLRRLETMRPDYVGFSCTTASFLDGTVVAEAVKDRLPGVGIVFGGVHVSALRDGILDSFPIVDFVVAGEGEQTMLELVRGEDPRHIRGLTHRDKGTNGESEEKRRPLDPDALPFPAYDLLEGFPKDYLLPIFNYPRFPGATLVTSRGCPYQCTYCDRSVYGRSYRYNSPAYVYEHMRMLRRRFGVRHINIYDDQFTFHRGRVGEFCEQMARRPLGVTFNCAVHAGHVDPELLRLLKKAGCWMVSLGIESGDAELVARHKRNTDLSKIYQTVGMIKSAGLRVKGLFMMGLPGETEESIRRTIRFILSLDLDDMNMSKFTPFPGAPIYRDIREYGSFEEDWNLLNCLNFTFVPKGIRSKERLDELYSLFLKSWYQRPAVRSKYVRMFWQSPHSWWVLLRHLPAFLRARNDWNAGSGERIRIRPPRSSTFRKDMVNPL